jgi:hypothetical protein
MATRMGRMGRMLERILLFWGICGAVGGLDGAGMGFDVIASVIPRRLTPTKNLKNPL